MLKGLTVSKSAAPTPPPWHPAGDVVGDEFWTDADEDELSFLEANGEELHALVPSRIESGFCYSLPHSVGDLKIPEGHGS
jgi:hypothetical protein